MNDRKFCLYLHVNLDKQEIFYVGIGDINRPYSNKSRSQWWHNTVNKYNYSVVLIHEKLSWEEACLLEVKYIKQIGRREFNSGTLVNMTDGGDGNYNPSLTTRKKLSDWQKGIKRIPLSDEHKAKIAKAITGIKRSDKTKIKMGEAKRGRSQSAEHIRKNAEARRGKTPWNKGLTGRKESEETKKRKSEAMKLFYSTK